jgi:hypothetical protein
MGSMAGGGVSPLIWATNIVNPTMVSKVGKVLQRAATVINGGGNAPRGFRVIAFNAFADTF